MSTFRKIYREGYAVSPRSETEIRNIAEQIRKLVHDVDIKFFDVIRFLEFKMPDLFENFRYEIVTDDEIPDREAEMNPREFCIRIRESVYNKALNGDGHYRLTIAHELGHFFLHRTQTLAFGRPAKNGSIPAYRHSEWQADIFARNLLAPWSMAKNMKTAEIEAVFGVSNEVARIISGEAQTKKAPLLPNADISPMLPGLEEFF